jgi:diguanylate cyclase (GGDEF)-like protein
VAVSESTTSAPGARGEVSATRHIVLFTATLAAAAVVLYVTVVSHQATTPPPVHIAWPLLAIAFALADSFAVNVDLRDNAHSFTMNELPLMIGLFLCTPEELLAARLVGMVLGLVIIRRQRAVKAFFNLALSMLETVTALMVFLAITDASGHSNGAVAWFAAIVAAVAINLVQSAAITTVIRLSGGSGTPVMAARMALIGMLTAVTTASLGIVTVIVIEKDPVGLLLIAAIAGLLFAAYRGYVIQTQRYANLEKLYELTRKLACSPDLADSMRVTLQEARELVRASESELVLMQGVDEAGPAVRVRLTGNGEVEMITDELGDDDLVRSKVVASGNGVVITRTTHNVAHREYLRARGIVDLVAVPVFRNGTIVGTLAAHNRLGDVSSFDDEDVKVFATLAHHVGTAIENARLIERLRTEVSQKEYQSLHDTLTGLANRDLFIARANDALRESRAGGWNVAVMLMDLNRFKDVNDTLGHHHGDLLLQEVAQRIAIALPEPGMIARLGGDEFVVLLPQLRNDSQAEEVAARIQVSLQQPMILDEVQLAVSAAIGIAIAPEHGTEVSTLLQHADIAMYNAKEKGDGGIELYDSDQNRHSPRRLALAGELQAAISDGLLEVFYQPKADLATGKFTGVEALVRWDHPQHGPIPPDEFVPLAEGTGQMRAMTALVLGRVLEQSRSWRTQGIELPISVNLSTSSLIDLDFAGQVAAMCEARDVEPNVLVLEITETQMMADPARTVRLLESLASLGIEFSVDDFGTGYSSLSYLQRLPVHEVKVDKSFVLGMTANDANAKIVRSIVDLGHNLGLRVVAEGVEDRLTWNALADMGCDIAQGYYLSRPLPGAQLTAYLQTNSVTNPERAERVGSRR